MNSGSATHVVVLHGVGAPAPGDILTASLKALAEAGGVETFVRSDRQLAGTVYPRAMAQGGTQDDTKPLTITEVNWADLLKPWPGAPGTLRHLFLLSFAMLDAAVERMGGSGARAFLAKAYRFVFSFGLFWCLWPAVTCLLVSVYGPTRQWLGWTIALGLPLLVAIAGSRLCSFSRSAQAGAVAWAGASGWLAIWTLLHPETGEAVRWSARLYSYGQLGGVILCAGACLSALSTGAGLVGRLGLLHIPIMFVSAGGAVLWSVALWAVRVADEDFGEWGKAFSGALGYDLRLVEFTATLVTGAVGGFAFVVALAYGVGWLLAKTGSAIRYGAIAQNGIALLLVLSPLAFGYVGFVFVQSFFGEQARGIPGLAVWQVYQNSALRVVPFVIGALGPFGAALDVLGDVAFYIARTKGVGIADEARERLRRLLDTFSDKDRVVIVAHSQGSVIAVKELTEGRRAGCELVAVGSPITTLYKRLLDYEVGGHKPKLTLYRAGDYLGGSIDGSKEKDLGLGGHTGYFADKRVWKHVPLDGSWFRESQASGTPGHSSSSASD